MLSPSRTRVDQVMLLWPAQGRIGTQGSSTGMGSTNAFRRSTEVKPYDYTGCEKALRGQSFFPL